MQNNPNNFKKVLFSLFSVTFLLTVFNSCISNEPEVVTPAAVTDFKASAGDGQVTLSWKNPKASSFDSVKLLKGTTDNPITEIATITDGSTSYIVSNLTNGTKYYFKAEASFDDIETTYSSAVIAATPKAFTSIPSVEFAQQLVIGWNLGNTLDANNSSSNNSGLSEETSWGMPYTTQDMIKAVSAAGFKTIRIPVSWHNHLKDTTNYTIDPAWMARVKEVVDWAIAEDMYVILNVHHDNQESGKLATGSGLHGFALSTTSSSVQTTSKKYLEKVWTQIATTFNNDYDAKLIFEVLNEPREVGTSLEWNINDSATAKKYCDVITDYENTCIAAIRATGGNNEQRYLMVPGYAASGTSTVMLGAYTLPSDTASDKLILSTHAYSPYNFAMANSDSVFGDDDKAALTSIFNYLKTNYTDKGIGVVMGEASASNKNNTAERIKWVNDYFAKAKAAGISVVLWDNDVAEPDGNENKSDFPTGYNGEHHGWLNRKSGKWYFPTIIEAMMDTVGVTGYSIPEYVAPTTSSIGWNESEAVSISSTTTTLGWDTKFTIGTLANAKEGSILKISFASTSASIKIIDSSWNTFADGFILNGNVNKAEGDSYNVITPTAKDLYYMLTSSDAAAWKSKNIYIAGSGTVTSVKFLANPSTN